MKIVSMLLLVLVGFNASARRLELCSDSGVGLNYLTRPVEMRSFYNGAVKVYAIDTDGEPVCCSAGVAVIVKNKSGHGTTCYSSVGENSVDVMNAVADYDPELGLLIKIETTKYVDGINDRKWFPIRIRVNMADETVQLEH